MKTHRFLVLPLLLIASFTILPFYLSIVMATRSNNEIYTQVNFLFGTHFLENLRILLSRSTFFQAYLNSIFVSGVSTFLSVLICALAGYTFAVYEFAGKRLLFSIIIATLMIPPHLGLVAYVWEMRMLHLTDTLASLMLPYLGYAYGLYWIRRYVSSAFPMEIMESARIDGAHDLMIFFRIVLPIIQPATFTLALLVFVSSWNNFMFPLVLINKNSQYTLPLTIANLAGIYRTEYGAQFVGIVLATIPLLIVFLTSSKKVINGLTAGALKE